jgi:hypothetical protein
MELVDFFEAYINVGWEIIAVHAKDKAPVFKRWNKYHYSPFIHQSYLVKNPQSNIAIRLGKVIDVEADTDEANDYLNFLLKDVPHMKYHSKRGMHHLFINPFKNLRKKIIKGIEFRGYGHCSMLPPSYSKDGVQYKWHENTTKQLTQLPDCLKDILEPKIGPQISQINCNICKNKFKIHTKRLGKELQVFENRKWECRNCRNFDIRPYCRKIKTLRSVHVL